MNYASPLLTCVSVISSGYETYKDLKSSTKEVPKQAKIASVAKLIVNLTCSILLTVGALFAGLYIVAVSAVLLNMISGTILSLVRQRTIKKRFELLNSLEPQNWKMMYNELKVSKEKGTDDDLSLALHRWIQHQESANTKGFLSDDQKSKLHKIGLIPEENPQVLSLP